MTDAILKYKHTTFNLVGAPSSAEASKVENRFVVSWLWVGYGLTIGCLWVNYGSAMSGLWVMVGYERMVLLLFFFFLIVWLLLFVVGFVVVFVSDDNKLFHSHVAGPVASISMRVHAFARRCGLRLRVHT